jgi:hypothetical protein
MCSALPFRQKTEGFVKPAAHARRLRTRPGWHLSFGIPTFIEIVTNPDFPPPMLPAAFLASGQGAFSSCAFLPAFSSIHSKLD